MSSTATVQSVFDQYQENDVEIARLESEVDLAKEERSNLATQLAGMVDDNDVKVAEGDFVIMKSKSGTRYLRAKKPVKVKPTAAEIAAVMAENAQMKARIAELSE